MLMEYRSEQNYLISLKLSISLDCSNFRSLKSSSYQSTKSLIPCVDNSPTDSCSKSSSKSILNFFLYRIRVIDSRTSINPKSNKRTSNPNNTNKTSSIEHRVAQPRIIKGLTKRLNDRLIGITLPSDSLRATTSSLIIESALVDLGPTKLFTLPFRNG